MEWHPDGVLINPFGDFRLDLDSAFVGGLNPDHVTIANGVVVCGLDVDFKEHFGLEFCQVLVASGFSSTAHVFNQTTGGQDQWKFFNPFRLLFTLEAGEQSIMFRLIFIGRKLGNKIRPGRMDRFTVNRYLIREVPDHTTCPGITKRSLTTFNGLFQGFLGKIGLPVGSWHNVFEFRITSFYLAARIIHTFCRQLIFLAAAGVICFFNTEAVSKGQAALGHSFGYVIKDRCARMFFCPAWPWHAVVVTVTGTTFGLHVFNIKGMPVVSMLLDTFRSLAIVTNGQ